MCNGAVDRGITLISVPDFLSWNFPELFLLKAGKQLLEEDDELNRLERSGLGASGKLDLVRKDSMSENSG